jgi:hypothetical protein
MKHKITFLISLSILISGCVSLPEPIDDAYLIEKTDKETTNLNKIEAEIIASKKEKDKIEKEAEIASLKTETGRKEIIRIESAGAFLLDKEKLYTRTKDERLADIQKQKEQNGIEGTQAKAHLDYLIAKENETISRLEIKKYDLAVKVAELNYEKALIAKAYQAKRNKDDNENIIDDEKYIKFLENQKEKLEDSKKNQKKAAAEAATMKENLIKSEYKGEI